MKTTQEMLEFARMEQGATIGVYDNAKNNPYKLAFNEVERCLSEDEEAIFTFIATSLSRKESSQLFYNGVAVTNKRMIIGGQIKGLLKVSYTAQSFSIENINSVNESYSWIGADLIVETLGDDLRFSMQNREIAGKIKNSLWSAIDSIKHTNVSMKEASFSSADELKKYKDLLDNGIITQEEFEQKKKQLLGL